MDFLKNIFNIKDDAQPVDVIRGGKELKENIETKNQVLEDLMKENPDLVNNLNTTGGITEVQPKAFNTLNNFYNQLTTPHIGNFGIMDLVNTGKFMANPSFLGGVLSPIGAFALGGLKNLFSNIKDPYKNAFGGLNRQTRTAINREQVRDLQDRIDNLKKQQDVLREQFVKVLGAIEILEGMMKEEEESKKDNDEKEKSKEPKK